MRVPYRASVKGEALARPRVGRAFWRGRGRRCSKFREVQIESVLASLCVAPIEAAPCGAFGARSERQLGYAGTFETIDDLPSVCHQE
jgi:hypothetical protein